MRYPTDNNDSSGPPAAGLRAIATSAPYFFVLEYATHFPSGDHTGVELPSGPEVSRVRAPRVTSITQMSFVLPWMASAARSPVGERRSWAVTEKSTRLPNLSPTVLNCFPARSYH